ncbi:hypothetical protein NECID01_0304 [Nematocida sp. AWRm77]|nr:hypothetical protein NECID01_0304 [Nematocida sp. AWRm77]
MRKTCANIDTLLEKIKTSPLEELKKEKSSIISQIVHGKFLDTDQILLRSELQKRLIEKPEIKDRMLEELKGTEEEISRQHNITGKMIKKLADSDGKLCKMKRGQEQIADEILHVQGVLQKRKKAMLKEDLLFLGVLGVFFAVCAYVVIDRLVGR